MERQMFAGFDDSDRRRLLAVLGRPQGRAEEMAAEPAPPLAGERHRLARLGSVDPE